jgi:hypothetical protein
VSLSPVMMSLAASLCLILACVGGFTAYHVFLSVTNQTTNERYKYAHVSYSDTLKSRTTYNKGIVRNLVEAFFPPKLKAKT